MIDLALIDDATRPELAHVVAKVKAELGRFSDPFKLLLHSPDVALAWLGLVSAIRSKTELDDETRELVILRVALVNDVNYVRKTHESIYGPKAGLSREQIAAIADWRGSPLFDERQRAVLAYTDAMTSDVQVAEAIQQELPRHFGEREIVELTVLIGFYNMCTRVFEAFEIEARCG